MKKRPNKTTESTKRENQTVLQRGEAYTRVLQRKTDVGVHALQVTKLKIFSLLSVKWKICRFAF